jgi:UDP-hydrolysing UDP-N-acetyl-D-glucosamine 2-epimerase
MRSTLEAIRARRDLQLQIVATGMHLSRSHGRSIDQIRKDGFAIDATVGWPAGNDLAAATMAAGARLAKVFSKLRPDVVLVTGDRVEAFAAASAGHLSGCVVAHVHGGDRALGQCDDALRHAITKLAHLHFPATRQSAERIHKLGEQRERIFRVGTPGLDDIAEIGKTAAPEPWSKAKGKYAVAILHPETADDAVAERQAKLMLRALKRAAVPSVVLIDPNNDPGWEGIAACYGRIRDAGVTRVANLSRPEFLRLLAGSGLLVGNSSSGIIEAASLGVRVVNIGRRQEGRERSANVIDVDWEVGKIVTAIRGHFGRRFAGRNVYGSGGAGVRIAQILSDVPLTPTLRHKLIRY